MYSDDGKKLARNQARECNAAKKHLRPPPPLRAQSKATSMARSAPEV
jgi:hypothetical protein